MRNSWLRNSPLPLFISLLLGLIMVNWAVAADDPDELYRQGRFAEAEKGYAQLEMAHPKDIRYPYNRGCAAYQNSDYQGALAAFSSVLERGAEEEVLFKAAFNLGNIVYQQGDFGSAAAYYKKAVVHNPANKEVRYNLELALRELKKQKDFKDRQGQHESNQTEKEKKAQAGRLQSFRHTQKAKEGSSQGQAEKDSANSADQDESQQSEKTAEQEEGKTDQDSPADLSGNLQALEGLPQGSGNSFESALVAIDRNKAEALLENVKEDRSKYLRFQIPSEKRGGVQSGKDW